MVLSWLGTSQKILNIKPVEVCFRMYMPSTLMARNFTADVFLDNI